MQTGWRHIKAVNTDINYDKSLIYLIAFSVQNKVFDVIVVVHICSTGYVGITYYTGNIKAF